MSGRPQDFDYAMNSPLAQEEVNALYGYAIGYVTTPSGVVGYYRAAKTLTLECSRDGRVYRRTYQRYFTRRGIAIVAGRFAREILGS